MRLLGAAGLVAGLLAALGETLVRGLASAEAVFGLAMAAGGLALLWLAGSEGRRPPSLWLRWVVTIAYLAPWPVALAAALMAPVPARGTTDYFVGPGVAVSLVVSGLLWAIVWRLRPRAYATAGVSVAPARGPAPGGPTPPRDPDEPVTVLASSDPGLVGVAKSLLEEADIPFAAINEQTQDLIGVGRIGGFNVAIGPVRIQVEGARADEALELLSELGSEKREEGPAE